MNTRRLRQWLKAGFLQAEEWHPTETGTPQGGIISPVLANLALDGLQSRLKEQFPPNGPKGHAHREADNPETNPCMGKNSQFPLIVFTATVDCNRMQEKIV